VVKELGKLNKVQGKKESKNMTTEVSTGETSFGEPYVQAGPGQLEVVTEIKTVTQPLPQYQSPVLQGAGGGSPQPAQPAMGASAASPMTMSPPGNVVRVEPPKSPLNELNSPALVSGPLPGIEQLVDFSGLRLQQHITSEELAAGVEKKQSFSVYGMFWPQGVQEPSVVRQVFTIQEQHGIGATAYLFNKKPYTFIVFNTNGTAVMQFRRKWSRAGGTAFKAYDPSGRLIGTIKKRASLINMAPKLSIYAPGEKNELFWIKMGRLGEEWSHMGVMKHISHHDEKFGDIYKKRGLSLKKNAYDIDELDLVFPSQSDLNVRALLMGAALFVDLLWYEKVHGKRDPQ